nr:hypothetical protein Iba_chr14dCG6210 [Ipomoea batatas]
MKGRAAEVPFSLHPAIVFSNWFVVLNSDPKTRSKCFCLTHKFHNASSFPKFNLASISYLLGHQQIFHVVVANLYFIISSIFACQFFLELSEVTIPFIISLLRDCVLFHKRGVLQPTTRCY